MKRILRHAAFLGVIAGACSQNFTLSNAISSHAVLQRDHPILLWGLGVVGSNVKALLLPDGITASSTVDAAGVWRTTFPARPASVMPISFNFTASTGENAHIDDVLIGDVYLCSGQSNMALPLSVLYNASDVVTAAVNYANVRIFQAPWSADSAVPLQQFPTVNLVPWQQPLPNGTASNSTLLGFSAVCYIFGSTLYGMVNAGANASSAVPVGLVASAHGGTSILTWISPANVYSCGDLSNNGWNASELYNSNIAPLTLGPMPLRGVAWYQGEEDVGLGPTESFWRAGWYSCSLGALIRDWRAAFASPTLPFLVQQMHAWLHGGPGDIGLALFRQTQMKALFASNVGYSTAFDGGDPAAAESGDPGGTVHSRFKYIPGTRLAAAMAGQFLNMSVPYVHPTYLDATATSVSNATHTIVTVNVSFVPGSTGGGLSLAPFQVESNSSHCPVERGVNASSCDWFAVQVNDDAGSWHNASVAVTPDGHGLSLTVVAAPPGLAAVATRNGYADWPVVTVYNSHGLPALTWLRPITL